MGWDHSELSDYRHRLSIALKAANICVFEVDVERQLYTYFENSEAIFGVPGDKILADVRPFSLLPPEEYLQKAAEYFVSRFKENAGIFQQYLFQYKRSGGKN